MNFSKMFSQDHHGQAIIWRDRIKGMIVTVFSVTIVCIPAFLITRMNFFVTCILIAVWGGAASIALMFIPLVYHNHRDDAFD